MKTSLILFTLSKHLNAAAIEIENLENKDKRDPISELEEMKATHYQATTPMDKYMTGMYNGIEFALSCLKGTEAQYKDVEKLEDMSNSAPSIEVSNGTEKTNGKASESSEKTSEKVTAKKATSTKKKAKEEVASLEEVNVPPPIPQEAIKRQLTAEIVRAECKKVIDSKGKPKVVEMLKALGAEKFSEVKESDYEILFNACRKELGEENEF